MGGLDIRGEGEDCDAPSYATLRLAVAEPPQKEVAGRYACARCRRCLRELRRPMIEKYEHTPEGWFRFQRNFQYSVETCCLAIRAVGSQRLTLSSAPCKPSYKQFGTPPMCFPYRVLNVNFHNED